MHRLCDSSIAEIFRFCETWREDRTELPEPAEALNRSMRRRMHSCKISPEAISARKNGLFWNGDIFSHSLPEAVCVFWSETVLQRIYPGRQVAPKLLNKIYTLTGQMFIYTH